MKLFDEILGLVRRYGPTLIAHLMLFVGLGLFVLDLDRLAAGSSLLERLSDDIGESLKAVGLSLQLWYVIAALVLAYLTAFEWLRSIVLSLPLIRISFTTWRDPELLARACRVLKLEPDPGKVGRALANQIDRCEERVRQTSQRHPYQWMIDRKFLLINYYGTVLIALAVALVWVAENAPLADRDKPVWPIPLLLAAIALVLRWTILRHDAKQQTNTGYWALYEYERENGLGGADPLAYERERSMLALARQDLAFRRHPAAIVSRLASRLLGRRAERLIRRLVFPQHREAADWPILASHQMRFSEETEPAPAALQAQPFAARFAPLLERQGTGLAILAPRQSGLAPAAPEGGARYSFATRSHGGRLFGIALWAPGGFDCETDPPKLRVETDRAPGFIVRVGPQPIERLITGEYPAEGPADWGTLLYEDLDPAKLPDRRSEKTVSFAGIELGREADVEAGSSYLLGTVTEGGTDARLVLQCFRIGDSPRLLIAWGYFDVDARQAKETVIDPWWKPRAWKGLIGPAPEEA